MMTMEYALVAAVAGEAGAIMVMWRWFLHSYRIQEERGKACEERERKLLERLIAVEIRTGCGNNE